MSNSPPEHLQPAVLALQIKQLEKSITALGETVQSGFDRLEKKLDDRLASRDTRLDEHEGRIEDLERATARKDGRDKVLGWIATAVGGAVIAGLVGLWWTVVQNGLTG